MWTFYDTLNKWSLVSPLMRLALELCYLEQYKCASVFKRKCFVRIICSWMVLWIQSLKSRGQKCMVQTLILWLCGFSCMERFLIIIKLTEIFVVLLFSLDSCNCFEKFQLVFCHSSVFSFNCEVSCDVLVSQKTVDWVKPHCLCVDLMLTHINTRLRIQDRISSLKKQNRILIKS